jgi:FixJ family two-component response regulator
MGIEVRATAERTRGSTRAACQIDGAGATGLELIVRGKQNKQIAHHLGPSQRTIRAHRERVMEKMDVKSLAELVSIAERLSIVATTLTSRQRRLLHELLRTCI